MKIIKLINTNTNIRLADACVLPDGQLAVAWYGEHKTHGTYPSLEAFQTLQSKIPGRKIEDYVPIYDELCFGIETYTFELVRDEDETGVSGTGVVAVGCDFFNSGCVLQWAGEIVSTFWYPDMATVRAIHGHGSKTRIVTDRRKIWGSDR